MFPQLYKIKPWIAFIIGRLIWIAENMPITKRAFIDPEKCAKCEECSPMKNCPSKAIACNNDVQR